MKYPPVHYHDYLKIDQLLHSQHPKSDEYQRPAHDEMLFIITHQAYELWFKQIIFELDSVLKIFAQEQIAETDMGLAAHRLNRIVSILRMIMGQIDVLETMRPLDFLEFRDFLYPASGFQSLQFRLIETKLGLRLEDRMAYTQAPFYQHLKEEQQADVKRAFSEASLFESVDRWLARTPFLNDDHFDFWKSYQNAVEKMLNDDIHTVQQNPKLDEEFKKRNIAMLEGTKKTFEALFGEKAYEELRKEGHFRLSYKALHAALLIQLYRDQAILQIPFQILNSLVDIDEVLTNWRYRHALMVHRMLGKKIGTGGSSGHQYLKDATDKHKIFGDFFNLSTYLIPRSQVPPLPKSISEKMNFKY
jgi:tryptophan 2,3-dioxygenase